MAAAAASPCPNLWRRLVVARQFDGLRLFLSDYFTPESRVLIRRNVVERVRAAGAVPHLRSRPLHRRRRRSLRLHPRRLHQLGELSLQRGLRGLGRRLPRPQLPAQLGQGGGRRLQRIGDLLRLRARRPDHQGLPQDAARPVQGPRRHAGQPAPARPLSGGPLHRPGRDVRHLPHDQPHHLLQPRGSLGGAARALSQQRGRGSALLRDGPDAGRRKPRNSC